MVEDEAAARLRPSHLRRERRPGPPEFQYLFEDLFETITIYDNRTRTATYKPLPDGKYQVLVTGAAACR